MSAARRNDGFIIVAVLWMVAALGVLAAIFTRFALTTAIATTVHEDRLQAESMMQAAVELTAFQITATDSKTRPGGLGAASSPDIVPGQQGAQPSQAAAALGASKRPTKGAFSFRLGRSTATVEYRTEAARIDLNAASKESFAALFQTFGAKPDDATFYADRILGWRTKPAAGENAEATEYRVAGLNYGPRQAPFQSVSELWLVHGIPTVLKERMLPFVTVYSGQAQVDPETAAPEVVAAMPNMTAEKLGTVLQQRAAPQGGGDIPGGQDPANSLAPQQGGGSKAYRLTMRVALEKGRTVAAEMVILVPEEVSEEPYRTLFWRDDFDGWR